jgi:hydroxymethylbilane synthase
VLVDIVLTDLVQVDICVHSMKDVPTVIPDGTVLSCYLQREDTRDVFISKKYRFFKDLPNGSIIGSSSLRRQAQLLAINPTWKVVNFRGNVQTRLSKLEKGSVFDVSLFFPSDFNVFFRFLGVVDGTLLALAGLKRLNMHDLIEKTQIIDRSEILPAVAQGAIGIQCRSTDHGIIQLLQVLNHRETEMCVGAERSFLATLEGNCRTPIAAQAVIDANDSTLMKFAGLVAKPDGTEVLSVEEIGTVEEFLKLGREAAMKIKEKGGEKFKEIQESFHPSSTDV